MNSRLPNAFLRPEFSLIIAISSSSDCQKRLLTSLLRRGKVTDPKVLAVIILKPAFQMPFMCHQKWRASTYDGHAPDQDSIDLIHFSGSSNISAGQPVFASAAGKVIEAHEHMRKIRHTAASLRLITETVGKLNMCIWTMHFR